jgi:glucokinase
MNRYLGIEIGGTKLQLVVGDSDARIIERTRLNVARAEGGAGIRRQIEEVIRRFPNGTFAGTGVGFGGPVDWRTGQICCSHQIEGWFEFELGKWLQERTGTPVRVDNDANTAALAEALKGAGQGSDPVFYVTLGSGVGGGLVVDGQIYHGAPPGEAEIGHVRLDRQGAIVEDRCSGWAVDRKVRAAVEKHPDSPLAKLAARSTGGEARFLAPALAENDPVALKILDETCEDLAFGLSHVTHLAHPRMIVLGGGLSLLGEPLRACVQHHLQCFVMDAFAPAPAIRIAALGEEVVPIGALLLAKEAAETLAE